MKIAGKIATGILAACIAVTVPLSASAAEAREQKVGGMTVKFITDFENLSGKSVDNSDALFGSDSSSGVDFSVKNSYGVDGSNAYVLGNTSADNYFAEASYNPSEDEGAKTDGLEGATDLIFYVNGGGETDSIALIPVFGEWDYDSSGNPVMKKNSSTGAMENAITFWETADDINTKYYSLADGETEWREYTGTSQRYVRLAAGFKGYVRIPLESFDPVWNSRDENDKCDLKHFIRFSFYYGIYNRHTTNGYAIAIDNIGFAGDSMISTSSSNTNTTDNTATVISQDTGKNEANGTKPNSPVTGDVEAYALVLVVLFSGAAMTTAFRKKKKSR